MHHHRHGVLFDQPVPVGQRAVITYQHFKKCTVPFESSGRNCTAQERSSCRTIQDRIANARCRRRWSHRTGDIASSTVLATFFCFQRSRSPCVDVGSLPKMKSTRRTRRLYRPWPSPVFTMASMACCAGGRGVSRLREGILKIHIVIVFLAKFHCSGIFTNEIKTNTTHNFYDNSHRRRHVGIKWQKIKSVQTLRCVYGGHWPLICVFNSSSGDSCRKALSKLIFEKIEWGTFHFREEILNFGVNSSLLWRIGLW